MQIEMKEIKGWLYFEQDFRNWLNGVALIQRLHGRKVGAGAIERAVKQTFALVREKIREQAETYALTVQSAVSFRYCWRYQTGVGYGFPFRIDCGEEKGGILKVDVRYFGG